MRSVLQFDGADRTVTSSDGSVTIHVEPHGGYKPHQQKLVLTTVSLHTKFEMPSFTHSSGTKEDPKLNVILGSKGHSRSSVMSPLDGVKTVLDSSFIELCVCILYYI